MPSTVADRQSHPLGPLVSRAPWAHPVRTRIWAAVAVAACATPIIVAATLTPEPSGYGTHQQLGFGPCNVLRLTGFPCPTCGMTTAFAHAVRGQWLRALTVQPMGFAIALAAYAGLGAAMLTLVTARAWSINWYRISPEKTIVIAVLLFASAWAYRIAAALH